MNQAITRLASYLTSPNRRVRLEAEGKADALQKFFQDYRDTTGENIDFHTDGIVRLQDDADKWGLELRVYISNISGFPKEYTPYLTGNTRFEEKYKVYARRINDNSLIRQLIRAGLRVGDS